MRQRIPRTITAARRSLAWSAAALLLLLTGSPLAAQSSLSIARALPPYDLTALLLANGHFSVSTRYTGEDKTLIYQEDGSGGRPVNYTSHIHFKVDDVIFHLPYELDPVTRETPPPNPVKVTGLFRDTLAGRPRINATMYGVMPAGDTVRFLFSMQPVKRPSGGFIRLSAEVLGSTVPHSVGVLMLIDTKIGDNDRAPIISSFGYQTTETEFDAATAPGMPEFWLGLEGTPIAPGLTARGNLRAPELIEPDYFLFGNWKDNTAVAGAVGLALAQWDERRAFDFEYTDSAILLLWQQQNMPAGSRRLLASTEIGIVDSLDVVFGGGGGGGGIALGGGGGIGGGNGCLGFDTLMQADCNDPLYHPYAPDSLQSLYLVTNGSTLPLAGARVVVPSVPAGLSVRAQAAGVIPGTLPPDATGVANLTFYAEPRLWSKTFSVPIALVSDPADTLIRDTVCITVPGLLGRIEAEPLAFAPLCPGLSDTMEVTVRLDGTRCLNLDPAAALVGAPADIAQFEIVPPLPTRIPANGEVTYRVRYTAGALGLTSRAGLRVSVAQSGLDTFDLPVTVTTSDTAALSGISRAAEFSFADPTDTLDLGAVCVGDTVARDWDITNIGGCELVIRNDYTFENDAAAQFSVENDAEFPLTILRGRDGRVTVRFAPWLPGPAEARFIIRSDAFPFADTLVVRGRGDVPAFQVSPPPLSADTLCPGERFTARIPVDNPTACPIVIRSVTSDNGGFTVDAPAGFIVPPMSSRYIFTEGRFDVPGEYTANIRVLSADAGEQTVSVKAIVASRLLVHDAAVDYGDVRRGTTSAPKRLTISSTGTAGVEIRRIRLAGANDAEYSYTLPGGQSMPVWLAPGATLDVDITFSPADLETRRAVLQIETSPGASCSLPAPVELEGRGVMPVIDAPRRLYELGRICAGGTSDTAVVLRNLGNAPLTVTGLLLRGTTGRAGVVAAGLPVTIPADSSRLVTLRIEPELLGRFGVDLQFTSDGEPFVPGDTVIRLAGAGVICGSVSIDTMRANIGEVVRVPVRIDAAGLTPAEVARLLNKSGYQAMNFSIGHDRRLVRFLAAPPVGGMIAGLATPATVNATGAGVTVTTAASPGDLREDSTIAELSLDVLLGDKDRTPLDLSLGEFAGGWHDLQVHDGLLLAEYCAIDLRYVTITGPVLRPSRQPLKGDGELLLYMPAPSRARLFLYDGFGAPAAMILDEDLAAGTRRIPIGSYNLPSGVYQAVLDTPDGRTTTRIVVVE